MRLFTCPAHHSSAHSLGDSSLVRARTRTLSHARDGKSAEEDCYALCSTRHSAPICTVNNRPRARYTSPSSPALVYAHKDRQTSSYVYLRA
eukprot:5222126-Pleurochrysis_carterae.AAC.2